MPRKLRDFICEECGDPFMARHDARFCSTACCYLSRRLPARACPRCGSTFEVSKAVGGDNRQQYCSISCARTSHGHTTNGGISSTYSSYQSMMGRCYSPRTNRYENYGGRGIKVCDRWRGQFAAFLADMGERPEGKSLDRIDGNGDYRPGNCRWATAIEQRANRR